MKKILTILGARPQFIKASVLSKILLERGEFEEILLHTGQHFDDNMSQIFFEQMKIPKPRYNLGIHGKHHAQMTGEMLTGIEAVLDKERPDIVLVYGDTNSTLAGALAAAKWPCKLVHVEGGLRSFNQDMPEEINRIITDTVSDLILCPTNTALDNLKREGLDKQPKLMVVCGDIMKDAVINFKPIALQVTTLLKDHSEIRLPFVLATIHRQENTADKACLENIFSALEKLQETYTVVMPLHPRTKAQLQKFNLNPSIVMIDPVGYFDMLALLDQCELVITDSGGLQKEAYFNCKPCVIVREQTEWVELVEKGFARLAGVNTQKITEAVAYFETAKLDYTEQIYGSEVGEKIYTALKQI
ncbi:UDP-N-acetylglucosamine 2-epimerase (non-hydrolyzing) [Flavobacteriaceae bacterium F08102]|nr:UDP-N-acetylglucosamine 2-epimerase (non-hydrolyzing) [Flavobacteriaceae bacterium F08102]